MRTKIMVLVMLFAGITCCTNPDSPLSNTEKDKIKAEVQGVIKSMFKEAQEANFQKVMEYWLDSPDFTVNMNGNSMTKGEVMVALKTVLNAVASQKATFVNEKYSVLDKKTVIYSSNSRWVMKLKDGSSVLQDPWAMLYVLRKTDGKWKVASASEAGVEKPGPGPEVKQLDQTELHKQFIGAWRYEGAKDTINAWEAKSYGTAIDASFITKTKGKTVWEGKQLWGYDKSLDKWTMAEISKGIGNVLYASWFTSKSKCVILPYIDISYPDKASIRLEIEFKSKDSFDQTMFANNKAVKTETWIRVK